MPGEDHLDALKKKLYERGKATTHVRRAKLFNRYTEEKRAWGVDTPRISRPASLIPIILIFSAIFFVVAVGYAAYTLFLAPTFVSTSDVQFTISGPTSVSGGEALTLNIAIANNNEVALESVVLTVEYPPGSKDAATGQESLVRERISLGTIASGEALNKQVRALVFGSLEQEAEVRAFLEYRLPSSGALYEKEETFSLSFAAPPIDIVVDAPDEVSSNQSVEFTISVVSNTTKDLRALGLSVQYPPGFQFEEASPSPTAGESFWSFGTLPPGDERTVTIRGVLEGQHDEIKGFHVSAGVVDAARHSRLETLYHAVFTKMTLKRPYVSVTTRIGGSSDERVVVSPEENIGVSISLENSLSTSVTNGKLTVEFSGVPVDTATVRARNGFYDSLKNIIVWDAQMEKDLGELSPSDGTTLSFTFQPLVSELLGRENPESVVRIRFEGTRVSDGFSNEPIRTSIERVIHFITTIGLSTDTLYSVGPLENTGPIPPVVAEKTSYTITWSLANSLNEMVDAGVQTVLPIYVEWEGDSAPATESLKFNEVSRAVIWDVGNIKSGTGIAGTPPRSVSFKVSITPSESQVGRVVSLTGPTQFSGVDSFTGKQIQTTRPALTTNITKDPLYRIGVGNVFPARATSTPTQ